MSKSTPDQTKRHEAMQAALEMIEWVLGDESRALWENTHPGEESKFFYVSAVGRISVYVTMAKEGIVPSLDKAWHDAAQEVTHASEA